jgi:23S rRNA pseudouridine2457 synthase
VATLIRFYKPYRVLCQFTDRAAGRISLAQFIDRHGVYPAGRLDYDSEGLVLLTDDGQLQARISNPLGKLEKVYLVQVEGEPDAACLHQLRLGVVLRDGPSRAVRAEQLAAEPRLAPREPAVPSRYATNHAWLEVTMTTGRNRQVRRMLAAVGHPVLRLIRIQVGPWRLGDLRPGEWREERVHLPR